MLHGKKKRKEQDSNVLKRNTFITSANEIEDKLEDGSWTTIKESKQLTSIFAKSHGEESPSRVIDGEQRINLFTYNL